MNKDKNITDAELEAEFVERNNNLKKTWNHIVDTIDNGVQNLEVPEQSIGTANSSTTLSADSSRSGSLDHGHGIFAASGSGFYNEDNDSTLSPNTRRRPSIIGEQTSRHSWSHNFMDSRMMDSINSDIHAMHSTDAEEFGGIAKKIDETFGCNALI